MTNQMYQMTSEVQKYSSKMTSINSKKLPAVYKKIDWDKLPYNFTVLDYGAGKYLKHIADFINKKGGAYYGYDKYNQTPEYNRACLSCNPDVIICSNVLNVIAENKIILGIVEELLSYEKPVIVSIYPGDRSWIGKPTTKGYQRNQTLDAYCLHHSLITYHGVITNDKSIVL